MKQTKIDLMMKKYKNLIFFVLQKKLKRRTFDEELIQAARIGLWQAIISYKKRKGKFVAYAFPCIWHRVCELFAKRTRKKELWLKNLEPIRDKYSPVYNKISSEEDVKLDFDILTEKQHKTIREYYFEGKPEVQIAAERNVTRQAVSFLIISAIQKLRKSLKINISPKRRNHV